MENIYDITLVGVRNLHGQYHDSWDDFSMLFIGADFGDRIETICVLSYN